MTTSSLRDEIIAEIDLATRDKRISPSNYAQLADEILKLIEKRFDREIQSLYRVRSGYDMVAHAQEVLRDFKKELLK